MAGGTFADVGLNPPGTRHDVVVPGVSSGTGIKFGDAVLMDVSLTTKHRAVALTATAGSKPVAGVCVSQTDPTNGSADGDSLEICEEGIVEVNLAASNAITKGDLLITSATAGAVKKLGSETGADIVGEAMQDMGSQAGVVRIACKLWKQRGGVS